MRKHNTFNSRVIPPTTTIVRPKKVFTTPVQGNLGKGLTSEQYNGILGNIGDLQEKAAVQRSEYDAYVEKNEKATVRSDYNIADITALAKSLELLIYDLQNKLKKQDKWNALFNQQISQASDSSGVLEIVQSRIDQLDDKIKRVTDELKQSVEGLSGVTNQLNGDASGQTKQIQNLVRILQALPGFVTDIESICNKADGGFDITFKTVKFDNIDLDAELPEEPDTEPEEPVEPDDGKDDSGGEEEPNPDDREDEPEPEPNTNPISSAQTSVTVTSPTDIAFNNIYADNVVTPTPPKEAAIEVIYSGYISLWQQGDSWRLAQYGKYAYQGEPTTEVNDVNLYLHFPTGHSITSVSVTPKRTARGDTSGRNAGGLVTVYADLVGNKSVRFWQISQSDSNNDSWGIDAWKPDAGITDIWVTVFGATTSSSSSTEPIPALTPSCGERIETPIEPEPEPEPTV